MEALVKNWIDVIIAIFIIWAFIKGYRKGFIIEFASLLALILGVFGAIKFADFTAGYLTENINLPEDYTPLIAFALTFIVIVIGVHFLARLLQGFVKMIALNFFNRIAGAFFSTFKTLLILSFILFFVESIDQKTQLIPRKIKQSSIFYYPLSGAAFDLLPKITDSSYFEFLQNEYYKIKDAIPTIDLEE
jgi:membrane protein required for colicin V production